MRLTLTTRNWTILLCAMALLLVPRADAPAYAQGMQDFTLHNETGVEIYELYVSPHATNEWEEDVLGEDTLPVGEEMEIHFSRSESAELWDLKVVDSEGDGIEWANINLLEVSVVTLYMDESRGWAEVE